MASVRGAIGDVLAQDHPQTVRQVFYRLTSAGMIEKTEAEYKNTIVRLLGEMRRSGEVPYGWIADGTRWMRKPVTFSSPEEALRTTARTYRRALWDDAPTCVEVWLEKEALAGVLVDVTDEWDVPLMVTRGYASMSFLHSAAESIHARADNDQHTSIYYFGDHDPSGVDIDRAVVQGIGESLLSLRDPSIWDFFGGAPDEPEDAFDDVATFTRVAVTPGQIKALNLPTRPTKRNKYDHRAKRFRGASVEVDAVPARTLKRLAATAIEQHVDQRELDVLRTVEAEERKGLLALRDAFRGSPRNPAAERPRHAPEVQDE